MTSERDHGPIRLLLVDEPAICRGIRMLLELDSNIKVIGEACDCASAISLVQEQHPHIILIDPVLPGLGSGPVSALQANAPACAVIVLSLGNDPSLCAQIHDCAAFVDKHDACESLLATVHQVAAALSDDA